MQMNKEEEIQSNTNMPLFLEYEYEITEDAELRLMQVFEFILKDLLDSS